MLLKVAPFAAMHPQHSRFTVVRGSKIRSQIFCACCVSQARSHTSIDLDFASNLPACRIIWDAT